MNNCHLFYHKMKKLYITMLLFEFYFGFSIIKAQTFNNDVAPIIFAKCAPCHNPNGINSQLPFTNYTEVIADTSGISTDVIIGHMPPWSPDTTYTKFLHPRTLTSTEKNKILQWINNGVPEGTGSAPVCPSFFVNNQLAGKADLVVGTGVVKSNANSSNTNPYNCFVVPLGLTEDKWLRAVEIVVGNTQAVHHVVLTIDTTASATSDMSGYCFSQPGQFGIGGWSSEAAPIVYPNKAPLKAGQRIPKGSSIVIQLHYAPGSDGLIDSTKVRLYFYNKDSLAGIRPVYNEAILQNWSGSIPVNSVTTFTVDYNINFDMSILATDPHSHFVCTKIINYAFNGTDTIPLIRVNDWHYHWQGYYYYPKPVKVPNGYQLESQHVYDNTTNNNELITDPNNPVVFGTKTTDEMLFDSFVFMLYQPGDENIDLAAIAAADTIYSNGLQPKPYENTISVVTPLTFPIISQSGLTLTSSYSTGNQWYLNGNIISGATGQTYIASQNGNYSVIVTDSGVSSTTSDSIMITIPPAPTITQNGTRLTSSSSTGNQWYLNGTAISGATDSIYTATQNGSYTAIVTISDVSSAPSNSIVITIPSAPTITQSGTTLTSSSSTGNQWYLNGIAILGATNSTYTVTQNGNYSVMVTSSGITSASSNLITITSFATGIVQNNLNDNLSIYPNPSKGVFTLQSSTKILSIEVTSSDGANILSQQINADKTTIDLSKERNGIYFINVISEKGTVTEKLILNR